MQKQTEERRKAILVIEFLTYFEKYFKEIDYYIPAFWLNFIPMIKSGIMSKYNIPYPDPLGKVVTYLSSGESLLCPNPPPPDDYHTITVHPRQNEL